MLTSGLTHSFRLRHWLLIALSAAALALTGCGGSDNNTEVANDPATSDGTSGGGNTDGGSAGDNNDDGTTDGSGSGSDGSDASGGGTDDSGTDGGNGNGDGTADSGSNGGTSTSQFCDEGTAGSLPAQAGDPAIDSVAAAVAGAPVATLENVSCTQLGEEGSDPIALQRTLSMDRANLQFLVNGEVVVQGVEAFRWVDSREYCAKPAPLALADGTVFELVAKFRPDTNQPTYYRQKTSRQDGSRLNQIECLPSAQ